MLNQCKITNIQCKYIVVKLCIIKDKVNQNQKKNMKFQPHSTKSYTIQNKQKCSLPTLPQAPYILKQQIHDQIPKDMNFDGKIYESRNQQKIIPGYNFQSLFRKKSHIGLARKKNKQQAQKKNTNMKNNNFEKETKNTQKGHWATEENKLYHWFLEIHNRHFIVKHLRRSDKIFKSMANFIRTRQAEQCRSHHQKMQKKYHNFYQILIKLRMDFYNTTDLQMLKIQLQHNNQFIKQCPLLSEQQLKNGNLYKSQQKQDHISQNSKDNEIQQYQNCEKRQDSLFGQNYQKGLQYKLNYQ